MNAKARVRPTRTGVRFAVRLTPRGGRDAIDGWMEAIDGWRLKARVSAPPEDGRANAALVALLAGSLGVAKSAVSIASGETARMKIVDVTGDPAGLMAAIAALGDGP